MIPCLPRARRVRSLHKGPQHRSSPPDCTCSRAVCLETKAFFSKGRVPLHSSVFEGQHVSEGAAFFLHTKAPQRLVVAMLQDREGRQRVLALGTRRYSSCLRFALGQKEQLEIY